MGEARFYCKIHFNTVAEAKLAVEPITAFIKEGTKAEKYWEDNRNSFDPPWVTFRDKFPLVTEFLEDAGSFGKDWRDGLCRALNFGCADDFEPRLGEGSCIEYSAMVWHIADWEPMMDFFIKRYGAIRTRWMSDEDDIDYFALLE